MAYDSWVVKREVQNMSFRGNSILGWSKFWKSAQIMPIRLNVAYFWPTWREELEFWTSPSNWVCPAHMKICCLCSKGQKFNVLDFDKNLFGNQFLCVNSIFEVFIGYMFPEKWKKIEFCHFCIFLLLYSIVKLYMGGAHSIWGWGPKFKFLSSSW